MSVNIMVASLHLSGVSTYLPRQRHLKLDPGELLGGQPDFAQEGHPAQV